MGSIALPPSLPASTFSIGAAASTSQQHFQREERRR